MRAAIPLALTLSLLSVPAAAAEPSSAGWRGARFGRTPAQVLAVFPGEATRLDPEVKLADGKRVAVGIDGYEMEGLSFDVRFIFADGKLALVSLKAGRKGFVDAATYTRVRDSFAARWGKPLEDEKDDNFVDMRQTRWNRGADRADLKYIPGTLVLLLYPRPASAQ
jgi:hypothetical protein